CDFSGADLSDFKFINCNFNGCNLSLARLNKAALRDVTFKDSKLLGLQFDACNPFGLAFSVENCALDHSSFYKSKLKKTIFKNSQLRECDFTECDLSQSVLDNCDLNAAKFERTILEKADLRTSFNYSIDPELNRIKKARFSQSGIAGLLDKYDLDIDRSC
ncbi:MAG: pentapeptide repeat-containing protein, partial [Bacteroidia bacterium]